MWYCYLRLWLVDAWEGQNPPALQGVQSADQSRKWQRQEKKLETVGEALTGLSSRSGIIINMRASPLEQTGRGICPVRTEDALSHCATRRHRTAKMRYANKKMCNSEMIQ